MRQNSSRNPGRSDIDLGLERRGTMRDLTDEQRNAFVVVAELMVGCDRAATAIRRDQLRRGQVQGVPADGRKPLKANTDRPILVAHTGGGAFDLDGADSGAIAWSRIAKAAEHSLLSLPLSQEDAEQIRKMADAARNASRPIPERPGPPQHPAAG